MGKKINLAVSINDPKEIAQKLFSYCQQNAWSGYDPYDALNSRLFRALPFLNFKLARLAITQGVKRFPINLRPLLLVPKTSSPKGNALFLSSIVKLTRIGLINDEKMINLMADKLLASSSAYQKHACWGYSFDWQTRDTLVPKGSPNIICTAFAANALLDAYEYSNQHLWLEAAASAAEFVLNVLFWREADSKKVCFSYTPLGRSEIHNANLLGAALLCRVGRITGQDGFLTPALDAARYSVSKQHPDGSWPYGEGPHQSWIDNFHTGYNLMALKNIRDSISTTEFDDSIKHGLWFYIANFFKDDGVPKYYHNATFPIDIHSVAQSIITLCAFRNYLISNFDLAIEVFTWAIKNMWDKRGFFYFQKRPYYTIRVPYMRWSQAWMLLALASLIATSNTQEESAK